MEISPEMRFLCERILHTKNPLCPISIALPSISVDDYYTDLCDSLVQNMNEIRHRHGIARFIDNICILYFISKQC